MQEGGISVNIIQLQAIVKSCSVGSKINDRQMRTMISTLASNILQLLQNQQKIEKQNYIQQIDDHIMASIMKYDEKIGQKFLITQQNIEKNMHQLLKIEDEFKNYKLQIDAFTKTTRQSIKQLDLLIKQTKKTAIKKQEITELKNSVNKIKQSLNQIMFNKVVEIQKAQNILNSRLQSLESSCLSTENSKTPKIQIYAMKWIDQQCFHYKNGNVVLDGNKITALEGSNIVGNTKLMTKNKFTIKINKMKRNISLGIISSDLKKKADISKQNNRVYYRDDRCYKCGQSFQNNKGIGFKVGDQLTVEVNINQKKIIWKVGSSVLYTGIIVIQQDFLKTWVPFLHIKPGDSVSIIN